MRGRFRRRSHAVSAIAQTVLFARELDPNGLYAVRREVAILQSTEPVGFPRLTEVISGKVQTIGSRKVVASPRGFLATLLDDRSVVAYYPPDRQAFSRWLRASGNQREPFSPYLTRATKTWPKTGQVVIALDMTEGVDEAAIAEELKAQKDLVRTEADAKLLAETFATIEGMRFTISVTEKIAAEWLVEFTEVIGVEAGRRLRPFLEGAVKRIGDPNLDLAKWRMVVDGSAISFRATLTSEQLRGVLESIHSPILTGQAMNRKGGQDPAAAEASLRYYKSVSNMLRGLGRFTDRLSDYNAAAVEYERSAVTHSATLDGERRPRVAGVRESGGGDADENGVVASRRASQRRRAGTNRLGGPILLRTFVRQPGLDVSLAVGFDSAGLRGAQYHQYRSGEHRRICRQRIGTTPRGVAQDS